MIAAYLKKFIYIVYMNTCTMPKNISLSTYITRLCLVCVPYIPNNASCFTIYLEISNITLINFIHLIVGHVHNKLNYFISQLYKQIYYRTYTVR